MMIAGPCPEWKGAILRVLVRKYPNGGSCLERALAEALDLGFAAGHATGSGDGAAVPFPASDHPSERRHA